MKYEICDMIHTPSGKFFWMVFDNVYCKEHGLFDDENAAIELCNRLNGGVVMNEEMPKEIWVNSKMKVTDGGGCATYDHNNGVKKYIRADQVSNAVKLLGVDEPPNKFIALYSDGSGGSIVRRVDELYFVYVEDEEKTHCTVEDIMDADHVFFVALPDNFKTWGEE